MTSSVSGVTRPPDWAKGIARQSGWEHSLSLIVGVHKGLRIPAFTYFAPLIGPVCAADRSFRPGHDLREKRARNVRRMQCATR